MQKYWFPTPVFFFFKVFVFKVALDAINYHIIVYLGVVRMCGFFKSVFFLKKSF